ncbi:MAG: PDZ domain-containing protein [Halofilum sp. (in: g-proteobacteria)]|nr:PDZ domain-containing protein [Halofilum sp. (in: g-proteobacteria)]
MGPAAATARTASLNIGVRELDDGERAELGLGERGLLVAEVGPGAVARAGIRPGDILLRIGRQPLADGRAARATRSPICRAAARSPSRSGAATTPCSCRSPSPRRSERPGPCRIRSPALSGQSQGLAAPSPGAAS